MECWHSQLLQQPVKRSELQRKNWGWPQLQQRNEMLVMRYGEAKWHGDAMQLPGLPMRLSVEQQLRYVPLLHASLPLPPLWPHSHEWQTAALGSCALCRRQTCSCHWKKKTDPWLNRSDSLGFKS
jgi:hypothetical protein